MPFSSSPFVLFEYGAILKGSQTGVSPHIYIKQFEYGAILKGSQTLVRTSVGVFQFEYGAILKGSQTMRSETSR